MRGSLHSTFLDSISPTLAQMAFIRKLGEYRGKQALFNRQRPDALETLRRSAIIESSESSNRLEGIVAPRRVIEGLVLKDLRPKNRSEGEIAGYKRALDLIHESAEHMPISNNVILQLHKTLYAYHPADGGKWKPNDNDIIERNSAGEVIRVRFKPVSAVETPTAMDELIDRYHHCIQDLQIEPLIIIPLFILDFLCVHPFSDGNGRSARLLTLILLYQHGYEVGRYISLERLIEGNYSAKKCLTGFFE
ncbi:MAG: Fic family protein [Pseudomonadales bacterium]|nr:Fic family protein [Pseudomonadales bacterium]